MKKLSKWWKKINTLDLPIIKINVINIKTKEIIKTYEGTHFEVFTHPHPPIARIWKNEEKIAMIIAKNIIIENER